MTDEPKGIGPSSETGPNVQNRPQIDTPLATDEQQESNPLLSKTVTIRAQVSEDFAQELMDIVNFGGLWRSLPEFVREALRIQRDKQIREARRKKKEVEK